MYGTYLAVSKEALWLHITSKYVMKSYTSLDEPSLLPLYASNPSSTMFAADHRGGYVRRVTYLRQEVKYSFPYYDSARLTP